MSNPENKLNSLLQNAGIDQNEFLDQLRNNLRTDGIESFFQGLEILFGENFENDIGAALSLRAIHLKTHSPIATFHTIRQIGVVRSTEDETKTRHKIGAGISLVSKGSGLFKHYFATGVRASILEARKFIHVQTTNGKFLPKISFSKRDPAQAVALILESRLRKLDQSKGGNKAISNLAEFTSLSDSTIRTLISSSLEWLENPDNKKVIESFVRKEAQGNAISEEAIFNTMMLVLGNAAQLHKNEPDVRKFAKITKIFMNPGEEQTISLAEFWNPSEPRQQASSSHSASLTHESSSRDSTDIAFQDKPNVNLGAAVVSTGLAFWVSKSMKTKQSHQEPDGKTPSKPPSGWKKLAKFLIITSLVTAAGVATWRAATLSNERGTSWVERAFDPSLRSRGDTFGLG